MKSIAVRIWTCVCLFVSVGFLPADLQAQKYSPEHPDVKAMADKGVEFLTSGRINQSLEYRTLIAYAVVEHGKRYNGTSPKNHPLVKGVCDEIVSTIETVKGHTELYFPALAVILLAETDARKYKDTIIDLVAYIETRQEANGSFTYFKEKNTCDTSQTQFAALAMFVAKHHGFDVDVDMAKRTLEWIVASQLQNGAWIYKLSYNGTATDPGSPKGTITSISMQAAGAGTAYLLSDFLQLNKRVKSMGKALGSNEIGLPRTVSVYVKPLEGKKNNALNKAGPLVNFDRGRLGNSTRAGNERLESIFTVAPNGWPMYYLYALERYAYFREQAEGDLGNGKIKGWYDETVEHFKTIVNENGSFPGGAGEDAYTATSFAVLVLVRSSEVIVSEPKVTTLRGGVGFETDSVLREGSDGQISAVNAEKNLDQLIEMMEGGATTEQLERLAESLKKQIVEFQKKENKSRGEIKAFLQSMISARNYYRRLVAVRYLAGEQAMDNVPALLYAVGDPDLRICLEAHDGLRLVSRKIDSMSISASTRKNAARDPGVLTPDEENSCRFEFEDMKKKWTEWYLGIRPGAELLD